MKDRQAQEDIWHLTLDDLWAAPAENPRLGGEGPFVINLSTSPAPISVPPQDELHIEGISVYLISRNEDGRQRFRLRLGPISTELEADAILSAVRERYPSALTATASEEDLRAITHATRNTKGAKPAATPPPVAKPVETKVATRPPEPKVEAKAATRPTAPKAEAKPAAKPSDAHIVMLPPAPVIDQVDDSDEPTGTSWEIDSLLPHLSGSAPQPKAKPPAAKAASVARKVAPPAKPKAPVAAKPAPQAPTPQIPVAAATRTPTAPAKAQLPTAPKPPVLTAAVETPKRVVAPPAPPAAKTAATPIIEAAAPTTPIAAVIPPPVVELAALPAAMRQSPAAAALPPLTVRSPRLEVRKSHADRAEPAKPVDAEKPAAMASTVAKKTQPSAPEILASDGPPADPLETDWAAILSAPVEDTQSRPALRAPAPPEPAAAATAKANDDSGLQRLVERSNALVERMHTSVNAVPAEPPIVTATLVSPPEPMQTPITTTLGPSAIAAEPSPPAVTFSPLNSQSIEQKLAKLAEILHGGGEGEAAGPVAPPPAPPVEAAVPSEPAAVANATETDFDIEISFDDDAFAAPAAATKPWFEVDRRQEPRPRLKSPIKVLTSIEEMVVVDEANNLADVVARQTEPVIDATVETDRTPILVIAEEPKPQDPPPEAPKVEIALVEAPIAEPAPAVVAPAAVIAAELTLEPELTLAPAQPAPPPVLIEELIADKLPPVASLEISAEPAPAPQPASQTSVSVIAPQLPELEFTIDDPIPKPSAEELHVPTVVLEPTPMVIRLRESAADHAAKDARHLSARAAARAAKKLRLAKDAAKKAAAASPSTSQPVPAPSAAHAPAPTHAPAHAPAQGPSNKRHPTLPHKKPATKPPAPAAKPPAAKQAPAAPMRPAASGERKVTIRSEHSTAMDSTQTIRALTPLELSDDQVSRWYVIQLATSQDDFDPDQIPQLDIFDSFRLYSVIGLDGARILHALRLGFFGDEISAQAVHGYLKAHFDGAAVKRVSIAERERFAENQMEARKHIGDSGKHDVIEMASPKPVPETRLADLQSAANQRPAEEKSIWSRIVSPLKRP